MEFSVKPQELSLGAHNFTLVNRHHPAASAYLINAAKPGSSAIQITGQKRNENQSQAEIAFDFQPPANRSHRASIVGGVSLAAMFLILLAGVRQMRIAPKPFQSAD
jgi:hypothetical protein